MEKKRNLWVIPTDKPSRLLKNIQYNTFWLSTEFLHKEIKRGVEELKYQNIYITSDEKIKEGDWCILLENHYVNGGIGKYNTEKAIGYGLHNTEFFKKIILTTDQDLIKDGVQAIEDEFLEWFVKNPSCEKAEVISNSDYEMLYKVGASRYKIIIPKEEPALKCELCKTYPRLEGTNKCERCYSAVRHVLEQDPRFKDVLLPDLRKKQETLEEAAEKFSKQFLNNGNNSEFEAQAALLGVKFGAKWQAERMYSEEEVKEILFHRETHYIKTAHHLHINEWFEQFKKK